jgi:hypothetical protein
MKREMKLMTLMPLFILLAWILSGCNPGKKEIRDAVNTQLKQYPASTLQDIYKSFFQDEFGPGHLIEDLSVAKEYFDLELEDMISRGRRDAEPCGSGKNFVRAPMDLVKDGIIPADDYFAGFLESSAGFKNPDIITWKKRWVQIEAEIEAMGLKIPNLEQDQKAILKMLDQGVATVHHSQVYSEKYDPHYRIMGKTQWEKLAKKYSL